MKAKTTSWIQNMSRKHIHTLREYISDMPVGFLGNERTALELEAFADGIFLYHSLYHF
jgi:hypothetical protein